MLLNKTLTISYRELQAGDLPAEDLALVERAKAACDTSYSPYSHFCVGAAVLLENGEVICGSNQENVAFTPGTCAERCAMNYANAAFPGVPAVTIAIAAKGKDGFTAEPTPPCGVCRQVLLETEMRGNKPLRLLLFGTNRIYEVTSVSSLLPFQFNSF